DRPDLSRSAAPAAERLVARGRDAALGRDLLTTPPPKSARSTPMSAAAQAAGLSGLDQIRAIFAGETGYEGMVKTLDLHPVSAEERFVSFDGSLLHQIYTRMGYVFICYT